MLPKKVDWFTLAQCDYFAVESLVQTLERPAMTTVTPLRESIFRRKLTCDAKWKETFEIVCRSYNNLAPSFLITYDNFGGYRLLYQGKDTLHPPNLFKRNPVGFVVPFKEGETTNLSVMSSERTGQQLMLLGPIRFVNSDCNPNCEYDFSSDSGIVQLRLKRKICHGDELFVKYGPEFFEQNACLCRTSNLRKIEDLQLNTAFDILLQDIIFQNVVEFNLELVQAESVEDNMLPSRPKKRKLRGRQLIEKVNELISSPLSVHESPEIEITGTLQNDFDDSVTCSDSTSDSSTSNETQVLSSDVTENEQLCSDFSELSFVQANNAPLSPLSDIIHSESIHETSELSIYEESPEIFFSPMLFEGSNATLSDATALINMFCSRFKLSDECFSTLHSMIKTFLPTVNNFPSGYS